jgi:hypothetical protein
MSHNRIVSDGQTVEEQPAPVKPHHPKTIAEAVEIVVKELSSETRDMIRQQDQKAFVTASHRGLGASIRNCMIFCNENLFDLMADFQKGGREGRWEGPADVDGVSKVIAQLVWEKLQQA